MKSEADPHLIDLATSVADGASVDWEREASGSASEDGRQLIEGLRLLERIADAHAGAASRPAGATLLPHGAPDPAVDRDPPFPQWGSLLLQERIGHGSFGAVYRAWDSRLDRAVALKLLAPRPDVSHAADTLSNTAIVDEGRLMARVRHPGVVTVFGADEIDGRIGIWMELVEGRTLEQIVRDGGPLPPHEVAEIGARVANALGAVHASGLIHRDIKAQNVMLESSGRLVLMDFGTGVDPVASENAGVAGTPLYLAPEVIEGARATQQSDLYSLGVLLFYLATAAFPVEGGTLREVRRAHARGERTLVSDLRPDFPRRLARVIDRAVARDPRDRFADASALETALRPDRRQVDVRRVAVAALVVAAVVAAGTWSWWRLAGAAPFLRSGAAAGLVQQQIDPDVQLRATIHGPVIADRYAPCFLRNPVSVAVCDLEGGTSSVVRRSTSAEYFLARPAPRALLAPDGRRIAYVLTRRVDGREVDYLVVSALDGSLARELFSQDVIQLTRWTPDGAAVIARAGREAEGRYVSVPVDGAGHRTLLPLMNGDDGWGDLSPDGRTLLVTHLSGEHSGSRAGVVSRDLVAFDIETASEVWRRSGPNDDYHGRWSPDGSSVVFASNAQGCDALYQQRLDAGRPAGPATYLTGLGRHRAFLYGFGSKGDLVVSHHPPPFSVFEAELDLNARTLSRAQLVTTSNCDMTMGGVWSPGGERVAFLSSRYAPGGRAAVIIQRPDGGDRREIPLAERSIGNAQLHWNPDGDSLAVTYSTLVYPTANFSSALLTIDERTQQEVEFIRQSDAVDHLRDPRWDSAARSIYVRQGGEILRVDSRSSMRTVFKPPPGERLANGFDVSASVDLAIATDRPSNGKPACVVRVVSQPTAVVRYTRELAGTCQSIEWTPDSNRLLVAASAADGVSLWLLDSIADTATRIATDVPEPNFWDMSLSPDGRRLLFTAGRPAARPNFVILKGIR